jgi:CRISPR/Cas system CSM-associated protein Csm3 (group 7 of RAMP superfamily)
MEAIAFVSVQVDLTITLEAALHIGTGMGLGQILDELTVQGPHPDAEGADLPYVPGSSLKGRLRHHARQLSAILWPDDKETRSAVEAHLFGFAEQPCGLVFTDAHLADLRLARDLADHRNLVPLLARSERSFVSLSRQRRVALDQRLFRLELVERGLSFATAIRGVLPLPQRSLERDLGLLLAAVRDLTHLGAHKGRGLGKCMISIGQVRQNDQTMDWQALVRQL